jgi:hypothetical protein
LLIQYHQAIGRKAQCLVILIPRNGDFELKKIEGISIKIQFFQFNFGSEPINPDTTALTGIRKAVVGYRCAFDLERRVYCVHTGSGKQRVVHAEV